MERIAIFPGSFDPFTLGHESIVKRSLSMFDKVIIAIGYNSNKSGFFALEKRVNWIKDVFANEPKVEVTSYQGLTVDFCRSVNAKYILRGLRTAADFEYERAIAQVNKAMEGDIESVFLLTVPEHTPINSTIVRDIVRHNGDVSMFIPKGMKITKDDIV
ncbi:MAG: pantetheine-phosphate adenylyltransferase [Bacteroidales bacterium]|nr:pantetheine-phosphate adenylyltransferase [Bacteroidales bacterium]